MIIVREHISSFEILEKVGDEQQRSTINLHTPSGVFFKAVDDDEDTKFLYYKIGVVTEAEPFESEVRSFDGDTQQDFFKAVKYFEELIAKRIPPEKQDPPSIGVFAYIKGKDCPVYIEGNKVVEIKQADIPKVFTPPQKKPFGRLNMIDIEDPIYDIIKAKFALNYSDELSSELEKALKEKEVFAYKMTPYQDPEEGESGESSDEPEEVNDEQLSQKDIEGEDEENMKGSDTENEQPENEESNDENTESDENGDSDKDGDEEGDSDKESDKDGEDKGEKENGEDSEKEGDSKDGDGDGKPDDTDESTDGDSESDDKKGGDETSAKGDKEGDENNDEEAGEGESTKGDNEEDEKREAQKPGQALEDYDGPSSGNQLIIDTLKEKIDPKTLIEKLNTKFEMNNIVNSFRKQDRLLSSLKSFGKTELQESFYNDLDIPKSVTKEDFIEIVKDKTKPYFKR